MTSERNYNRRQLLRIASLAAAGSVIANCSGALPVPPPVSSVPAGSGIAAYIKGIADGVIGAASKLGVAPATIASLTAKANSLSAIADKVSSALAVGGQIATYAQEALPVIETIVSFIPGGSAATGILTAIQTLLPLIAAAGGRQLATRPTGQPPEAALAVLNRAAAGIL